MRLTEIQLTLHNTLNMVRLVLCSCGVEKESEWRRHQQLRRYDSRRVCVSVCVTQQLKREARVEQELKTREAELAAVKSDLDAMNRDWSVRQQEHDDAIAKWKQVVDRKMMTEDHIRKGATAACRATLRACALSGRRHHLVHSDGCALQKRRV